MSRANFKNLVSSRGANKVELSEGLWNIYKPRGVTSFDMVRKIKWMTGEKKVGHAGTLDPLAEGVLVVGIGRESTKKLRFVLEKDKEYIAEIKLGMNSETDDEEGIKTLLHKMQNTNSNPAYAGQETQTNSKSQDTNLQIQDECELQKVIWPSLKEIEKVLETFIGDIVQVSPAYSAVKIGGERAYKKARRGEKFTQPPRVVTIKEIEILNYQLKKFDEIKQVSNSSLGENSEKDHKKNDKNIPAGKYPVLKIKCVVGSGTYIRSLAREIGKKLKTDGYLTSLTRTRIGNYKIEDAVKVKLN